MRHRALFAVVIALSLGMIAAKAEGQTCFMCDQYEFNGYWRHTDMQLFWNELHGDFHPNGGWGSCDVPEHLYYNKVGAVPPAATLELAVGEGDNAALLRLLLEMDGARLNVDRSALQVVGSGDRILVHMPLSRRRTARLQLALNEVHQRQIPAQSVASGTLPPAPAPAPAPVVERRASAESQERSGRKEE